MKWYEVATCRGMSPAVFHDDAWDVEHQVPIDPGYEEAVAICQRCPVRRECLEDQLTETDLERIQGVRAGGGPKVLRLLARRPPLCRRCGAELDPLDVIDHPTVLGRWRCEDCRNISRKSSLDISVKLM